jgi:SAM-dependent methyltransferase
MTGIDAADDPQALLTFLDEAAEVAEIRNTKRRATEALALQPGDRVLEVGCGTGVDLPELVAAVTPGGRVVGVDLSELAIEHATRRMAAMPEARLLTADAHELPFPAGSFDACRVDRTMLHLSDPARALAELRRVLIPGGRLVISENSSRLEGSPAVVQSDVQKAIARRQWHQHETVAPTPMFLPLLMSQGGFEDIRIDRMEARSKEFKDADRLLRLCAGADEAVQAGVISSEAARSWLADVRAGMGAGEVRWRSDTFLFVARAPDEA